MDPKNRFSLNGQKPKDKSESSETERRVQVTQALTERFDALNKRWAAAEAELKTIPIPVSVWITIEKPEDFEPDPDGETLLGFSPSKNGWRICLGWLDYHDPAGEMQTGSPIVECSLEWRIKAVPYLPELREKVLKEAEESVTRLDDVLKNFK